MKLINADRADIAPVKLRDYLLSPTHPVGRFKAAFFASLGYHQGNWKQFELDLRSQHLTAEADLGEANPYGQKFIVRARMKGPSESQQPSSACGSFSLERISRVL
jgi:hypothetical protein